MGPGAARLTPLGRGDGRAVIQASYDLGRMPTEAYGIAMDRKDDQKPGPAAANEHIARLAAAGLARLPTHLVPMDLLRTPGPRAKKSVLEALLEERAEGR